jgi:hypothetical protein
MEEDFAGLPLPSFNDLGHTIWCMVEEFIKTESERMESEDPSLVGENKICLFRCRPEDLRILYCEVDALRYATHEAADEMKTEYLSKAQGKKK